MEFKEIEMAIAARVAAMTAKAAKQGVQLGARSIAGSEAHAALVSYKPAQAAPRPTHQPAQASYMAIVAAMELGGTVGPGEAKQNRG